MNRRDLLAAIGGSTAGITVFGRSAWADEPNSALPDSYRITPNSTITLATQSTAVIDGDPQSHLIRLGTCSLKLDDEGRLTALVKAGVIQYATVDYWISLAVFDDKLRFLGAATHKEEIQYVRLGSMPTMLPELPFDFGISKTYRNVARMAVAISDRDVPKPDNG